MKIDLTRDQCLALIDYIEFYLLDAIRKDEEIDNLLWVQNIISAKAAFEKAVKENGK